MSVLGAVLLLMAASGAAAALIAKRPAAVPATVRRSGEPRWATEAAARASLAEAAKRAERSGSVVRERGALPHGQAWGWYMDVVSLPPPR